jgi:hypothetical protein
MKQSVDFGLDDHPRDADRAPASWAVAIADDCDECLDLRVELTLEEQGQRGRGVIAHLSPASARRLRAALTTALRHLGEETSATGGG